jgi:hypothetical protein
MGYTKLCALESRGMASEGIEGTCMSETVAYSEAHTANRGGPLLKSTA